MLGVKALQSIALVFALKVAPALERFEAPVLWPGKFSAIAKILRDSKRSIEDRRAALFRLAEMNDSRIEGHLHFALAHRESGIQLAGLEICATYEVLSCIPQATAILEDKPTPLALVAALNVIALVPDSLAQKFLSIALSDPTDLIRSHAALVIGNLYWPAGLLDPMRYQLMIRLGDSSARVRRQLVEALGKLGAGSYSPAALALTPLLEDPDSEVRFIAAHSLGQLQDPRTIPALLRSIEGDPDLDQATVALSALAKIDDASVDKILQDILKRTGFRINFEKRVLAIGERKNPDQALLEDIARTLAVPGFGDEGLKNAVFKVLLIQGNRGLNALRSLVERGISVSLRFEAQQILASGPLQKMETIPSIRLGESPNFSRKKASLDRMTDSHLTSVEANRLTKMRPDRFSRVLEAQIHTASSPIDALPWLILVEQTRKSRIRIDRAAMLRLFLWATDPRFPLEARCCAIQTLVLAQAENRFSKKQRSSWLSYLVQDHNPEIRECTNHATQRFEDGNKSGSL